MIRVAPPQAQTPKERALELFARARREHSSPCEIGLSVAVGVFCACTPLWGFHTVTALALATVFRLNRLWAALSSRLPIFLWIAFSEIQIAHRLRSGAWVGLAPRETLSHGRDLLTDWILGTAIVGSALAAVAGCVAYGFARRWSRMDRERAADAAATVSSHTPDERRPPSSGSPPSGRPEPRP